MFPVPLGHEAPSEGPPGRAQCDADPGCAHTTRGLPIFSFIRTAEALPLSEFDIHSQLCHLKIRVNMFMHIPIFFSKQTFLGCY